MSLCARRFLPLLSALLLAAAPARAAEADVNAIAQDIADRNGKIIMRLKGKKEESGEIPPAFALEVIREEMSPLIDYERVTRRAMGRNWKKADDDQRARVVAAFRALLENTYSKVLSRYQNQQTRLASAELRPKGRISAVLEISGDSKAVSMEYVLAANDEGEHRVTDIKVEKISLVANYRRQFAGAIKKRGMDGFVDFLEEQARAKAQ
jgi:phospholipid transport system substrate-binding protein